MNYTEFAKHTYDAVEQRTRTIEEVEAGTQREFYDTIHLYKLVSKHSYLLVVRDPAGGYIPALYCTEPLIINIAIVLMVQNMCKHVHVHVLSIRPSVHSSIHPSIHAKLSSHPFLPNTLHFDMHVSQ